MIRIITMSTTKHIKSIFILLFSHIALKLRSFAFDLNSSLDDLICTDFSSMSFILSTFCTIPSMFFFIISFVCFSSILISLTFDFLSVFCSLKSLNSFASSFLPTVLSLFDDSSIRREMLFVSNSSIKSLGNESSTSEGE